MTNQRLAELNHELRETLGQTGRPGCSDWSELLPAIRELLSVDEILELNSAEICVSQDSFGYIYLRRRFRLDEEIEFDEIEEEDGREEKLEGLYGDCLGGRIQ